MKREIKKLEFRESLGLYISSDIFEGPLETVAANVLNLEERLRKEHALVAQEPERFARFELSVSTDDYGGGSPSIEVNIYGIRIETDAQFEERMEKNKKISIAAKAAAKKRKKADEEKEYQTFLKLEKKFKNKKPAKA